MFGVVVVWFVGLCVLRRLRGLNLSSAVCAGCLLCVMVVLGVVGLLLDRLRGLNLLNM